MLDSKYIYFKMRIDNATDCYIRKFKEEWDHAEVFVLQEIGWTLVGKGFEFLYFKKERT